MSAAVAVGSSGPAQTQHLQVSAPQHGVADTVTGHHDTGRPGDGAVSVTCPWATAPLLRAVLRRLGDRLPVAVRLVVLGGQLLPGGWSRLGALPVAVRLLVGLPRGAVDHLVPAWVQARRLPVHVRAGLVAGYVLAAAAMLVVLHFAPAAGLLLFLVLSLLHFGTGEFSYHHLRETTRGRAACGTRRWAALPLSLWPARTGSRRAGVGAAVRPRPGHRSPVGRPELPDHRAVHRRHPRATAAPHRLGHRADDLPAQRVPEREAGDPTRTGTNTRPAGGRS